MLRLRGGGDKGKGKGDGKGKGKGAHSPATFRTRPTSGPAAAVLTPHAGW